MQFLESWKNSILTLVPVGKLLKVSRVSEAYVAAIYSFGWVSEHFGVNQSATSYTHVRPVRAWVVFSCHKGASNALAVALFMISSSSSEAECHLGKLYAGRPKVCVLHHTSTPLNPVHSECLMRASVCVRFFAPLQDRRQHFACNYVHRKKLIR